MNTGLEVKEDGQIWLNNGQQSILVSNQEKAKEIIKAKFGHDIDQMNINTNGYQYPIPGLKWKIMYDSPLGLITDSPYSTDKKVAVISLPESEKEESQEELWLEAQCFVKDHLGTYSNDLVCDLARWAIEAMKKHYTITRKP